MAYPAEFLHVMTFILSYEGGLTRDTGGLTKFGVSQKAYPRLDIANLTRGQAIDIYHRDYWVPLHLDKFPTELHLIAMDCAVNEGMGKARQFLRECATFTEFYQARELHYRALAHSPKFHKYLEGWLTRLKRVKHDTFGSGGVAHSAPVEVPGPSVPPGSPADVDPAQLPELPEYTWQEEIKDEVTSIWRSKIAWLAGLLGIGSTSDNLSSNPQTVGLLGQLVHQPSFWIIIVTLAMVIGIIYYRWRDHGRGAK